MKTSKSEFGALLQVESVGNALPPPGMWTLGWKLVLHCMQPSSYKQNTENKTRKRTLQTNIR